MIDTKFMISETFSVYISMGLFPSMSREHLKERVRSNESSSFVHSFIVSM